MRNSETWRNRVKRLALLSVTLTLILVGCAEPETDEPEAGEDAAWAALYAEAERLCGELLEPGMDEESQIRAVYGYARQELLYVAGESAADWRAAAEEALLGSGTADCLGYAAVCRLLFDALGLENRLIQRAEDGSLGTHYWNLVCLDGAWYHVDACPLDPAYGHTEGCLLTDEQLLAYNRLRPGFYTYEKSDYPTVSDVIRTPTPGLGF